MRLNRGQEEAVRHGEGPCMVLAPPGSGKTLTIARRIACLIRKKGVKPEEILVITFTRCAAREMRERFFRMKGMKDCRVNFGTFHSIFYWILKSAYGLSGSNLMSEQDCMDLLRQILDGTDVDVPLDAESEDEVLNVLRQEIGYVKNKMLHLNQFHSQTLPDETFAEIFREYERRKKEKKKFDFDDMMVQCYALFMERPDILEQWQKKFRYILIDEFQDINRIQYEVMRMLAMPENNIFVVGDDDQSIYGFRGAQPELMLYMKQEYPDIRTINLTVNYRSTEFIVVAATRLIYHNENRFYKRIQAMREKGESVHIQELKDEAEEARYVAGEVKKLLDKGEKGQKTAVLYRTAMQARMLTEVLGEYRIPFEMREHVPNFYSHFIPRDILAYLKLAAGKRDRSLFLQVGNRPVRYLSRQALENSQVSFEDLRRFYQDKEWMLDKIDQFETDIRMLENMAPYAAIQYIRKRTGYDEFLKEYSREKGISLDILQGVLSELEERSKSFRSYEDWQAHIDAYTEELKEQMSRKRENPYGHRQCLQLMTMHGAKGLEFDNVFIIHANEGDTPYQKAETAEELEEERRMFYVAMTRAKNRLVLSCVREKNGSAVQPSRFLAELAGEKTGE